MKLVALLPALTFLVACSAPTPPTVDGQNRVLIDHSALNATSKIDLSAVPTQPIDTKEDIKISDRHVIFFKKNSTKPLVSETDRLALSYLTLGSKRIVILGRTDSQVFSESDEAIARSRAISIKNLLVTHYGVPAHLIEISYQSGGDLVSNKEANNRRAEITFFYR